MSRFTAFLAYSAVASLIYTALLFNLLPLPGVSREVKEDLLPVVPWWTLVSFGSYLLWQVGWALFNFNDVPEAYESLMVDIKNAKDFLRERGVDVDS
ncbi:dolichol-phosphate mannosyltransferase subunit 3 [Microstroma glucosiphilum]|uniref:Dolichol-phosphate mannosyltransferase subunit 3 n=1 Tax=Pseudomicrostroma glucosiphilum TaxID=1684307 RepID=A0A316U1K3_9BASI|nr:dolichol-phosphate mannosyltransferase subunit 3 [Pseudomicrostroma glucosiphilum]PWN19167.1 dolichol-phosphate mannosyltransferase subunit 3 [Pseudomicrostroma glucosiphilum]